MEALPTPASEGLQTVPLGYHSPRVEKENLLQTPRFMAATRPESSITHTYTSHQRQRTICGLRIPTFFLALALAILIVLAAVGGGVGGSIAARNASKPATTCNTPQPSNTTNSTTPTTPTTPSFPLTNLSVPAPGTVQSVYLNCPNTHSDQTYTSGPGYKFSMHCGVNMAGLSASDGSGTIKDITGIVAYSFSDCMEACAEMNDFNRVNKGPDNLCQGVSFSANMSQFYSGRRSNCYLKNTTGPGNIQDNSVISAKMLS